MTRQDKVVKAIELLDAANELLKSAGFKLIYDTYENTGVYAVPEKAVFTDDYAVETSKCGKSFDELTDASEFLLDCPTVLAVEGLYIDGTRLVDEIPYWWKGWSKFIKPKTAKEKA